MKRFSIFFILFFFIFLTISVVKKISFWNDSWLIYSEIKSNFTDHTESALQNTSNQNISTKDYQNNNIDNLPINSPSVANINTNNSNDNTPPSLPYKINNPAPFIIQAPLGNWDQLHEEACEETSLLIAHYFLEKKKIILSKEAEEAIQKLSSYTKNVFPKKDDLTIEELKIIAEKFFNHQNWKIINNPDILTIKRELSRGNIIIAPMAGRELHNPFYKNPGPLYHMLIISGYDENKKIFITQDPGTKKGKDFPYPFEKIMVSLHDFPGQKEKIKEGEKRILIVFSEQ